jgi:glycerate 2-kinase
LAGPLSGLVITRYGHAVPTRRIEVAGSGPSGPRRPGRRSHRAIAGCLEGLTADDLVLCLLSGGGSALLTAPPPGVSLADKRQVVAACCGAAPRSRRSTASASTCPGQGRPLAPAAGPARFVTLAISDVPGDDPALIASGPTVADATTSAEAQAILARYGIDMPRRRCTPG